MSTMMLVIKETSEVLNPSELADFLYLFRAANVGLNHFVPTEVREELREPTPDEIAKYRRRLAACSPQQLDSFFNPETNTKLLQITDIRHQSPLKIGIMGCAFLLTLGVFF